MTLNTDEIRIAIRALDRKPYAQLVPLAVFRSAEANGRNLALTDKTADTLREAIETGVTAGIFTADEMPRVRQMFALKVMIGGKSTGPTMEIDLKSKWPWKTDRRSNTPTQKRRTP